MGCYQSAEIPESARWKQKRVTQSIVIAIKSYELAKSHSCVTYEYVQRLDGFESQRPTRMLYIAGESTVRLRFCVPHIDRCQGMAINVDACCGDEVALVDVWVNCETLVTNYNKVSMDDYSPIKFWVDRARLKEGWNELHLVSSYSSEGPLLISDIQLTFYENASNKIKS